MVSFNDFHMTRYDSGYVADWERTISEIGCQVGYDSASKFAMAFKKVMKLSPSEYRMERGKKNGNE